MGVAEARNSKKLKTTIKEFPTCQILLPSSWRIN
jgi:hypothetical protein